MVHKGETVMTTLVLMVVVEETNARGVGMVVAMIATLLIAVMGMVMVVTGREGAGVLDFPEAGVAVMRAGLPQMAWIEHLTSFVTDLRI